MRSIPQLEKTLQQIFSYKSSIVLPKYKNLTIKLEDKQIKLAIIDDQ